MGNGELCVVKRLFIFVSQQVIKYVYPCHNGTYNHTGCSILHPPRHVNSFLGVFPPKSVITYYTSIVKRFVSSRAASISSPKQGFQGRSASSQRLCRR